jgi:very-long-chain ceramide synthase
MLPLPSPFPDPITAQINSTYSTISTTILTVTAPIITPFASSFSTLFPETTSLLAQGYAHLPNPLSGVSQFASVGPYTINWVTQQYKCWISQWIAFSLLLALQAVNLFWLFLIVRILWRVVRSMGEEMRDERSEYDSDEDDQRREELEAEKRAEAEESRKVPIGGNAAIPVTNGTLKH